MFQKRKYRIQASLAFFAYNRYDTLPKGNVAHLRQIIDFHLMIYISQDR